MTESGGTSETAGAGNRTSEAYSFACMNCGYGWEQTYEIEHYAGSDGQEHVTYWADGRRVPSPLTHPTCPNCEGHKLRIMRSGRVATAVDAWHHH
ncbi:hypothetical protein [Streptomyces sp. TR06-5]|uniref:hypothetical protein n=1 Tax=unclassified Streptomyces TaxID=2593676 RepID=UPI0039A22902